MRRKALLSFGVAIFGLTLAAIPAHAQDGTIARSYTVTPKDGMVAQFEAALSAHTRWRAENGDPWTWGVNTVEVGENLGTYGIRSGGHTWADLDAYDAGFGPEGLVHWNATVAPLVASIASTISTTIPALSNLPADGTGGTLAFVTVTTFHLRPGREADFNAAVAEATQILKANDFGQYSVWTVPVSGGGPGPTMSLVSLHTSWASMAEPDPTFEAILAEEMGQEAFVAWITRVGGMYRGVESQTLRLRPDLGVNQN
ncbi:MAG: hypothetical protein ACC682_10555 [Gemmatimonadota bacterium]